MSLNNDIQYNNTILKVSNAIKNADYILVGGASGMSAAGGPNWYDDNDEIYLKNFQDIQNKYFLHDIYFEYKDLKEILEGKEFDIVTTNQDGQFVKAFPEKNVAIIQGDWSN